VKSIEWAAGLFEGEGCSFSGVDKRNGNQRFSLHLGGKDLDVIQEFAAVMQEGKIVERKTKRKDTHATIYMWQVYARNSVQRCLSALLPHLGNRRAYKALNILDDLELSF